jgi:prolyl-tRNA synthetase
MATDKGELVLAVIRGDLDVNETKLAHLIGANQLRAATVEEIRSLGSEPGFISPVGLTGKVKIVGDTSLRTVINAYGGANALHRDALNINIDRDYSPDVEGDIAMAQDQVLSLDGKAKLIEKRGIEVGNIFQLGYHYTQLMSGATFTDQDGTQKPFYMGCYGIGLGRTLAAVVEKNHNDKGIIWPTSITPFQVHLISLPGGEEKATELYHNLLKQNIEVVWDDREVSAGTKFADADLIGVPLRLVISKKTGDNVEMKLRANTESSVVTVDEALKQIRELYT